MFEGLYLYFATICVLALVGSLVISKRIKKKRENSKEPLSKTVGIKIPFLILDSRNTKIETYYFTLFYSKRIVFALMNEKPIDTEKMTIDEIVKLNHRNFEIFYDDILEVRFGEPEPEQFGRFATYEDTNGIIEILTGEKILKFNIPNIQSLENSKTQFHHFLKNKTTLN